MTETKAVEQLVKVEEISVSAAKQLYGAKQKLKDATRMSTEQLFDKIMAADK